MITARMPSHAVPNLLLQIQSLQILAGTAERMKNFAVIYLVDISEVPDFNAMYELYDPCTVMFFFRNKVSGCVRRGDSSRAHNAKVITLSGALPCLKGSPFATSIPRPRQLLAPVGLHAPGAVCTWAQCIQHHSHSLPCLPRLRLFDSPATPCAYAPSCPVLSTS